MKIPCLVVLFAAAVVPGIALGQCLYAPGPQPEPYAANQVKLKYLATGPGFGDDRPELKKSTFIAPALVLDLNTVHSLHVTIFKGSLAGPVMWSTDVPPSATLWTSTILGNGNVRWKYNDPLATYGVKKIQIVAYVGGLHIITKFLGTNASIVTTPVTGVDPVHLLVEIDDGAGAGVCYEGGTAPCTGGGNTQVCQVL